MTSYVASFRAKNASRAQAVALAATSALLVRRAALVAATAAALVLASRALGADSASTPSADDVHAETLAAPALTGWQTATHFGFAVVDRSSTGFRSAQGSLLFFDVGRTLPGLGADWQLGLRTIGEGGSHAGQEFYRMAAGPYVAYRPATGWLIHGNVGAFRESGLDGDAPRYRSSGWLGMVGWERTYSWGSRVEAGVGGFLSRHSGAVSVDPAAASGDGSHAAAAAVPGVNEGLSHGVEASLRVRL